jgi:hypothetical protein
MTKIAERIRVAAELLALIDSRREQAGDPHLGAGMEHAVIHSHLREIEEDILNDPGAMEPWLVRRRQS